MGNASMWFPETEVSIPVLRAAALPDRKVGQDPSLLAVDQTSVGLRHGMVRTWIFWEVGLRNAETLHLPHRYSKEQMGSETRPLSATEP